MQQDAGWGSQGDPGDLKGDPGADGKQPLCRLQCAERAEGGVRVLGVFWGGLGFRNV